MINKNNLKTLREGDKVYISIRDFNETVVRTTKTQLITKDGWKNEHRYNLETGREIGGKGIAVNKYDERLRLEKRKLSDLVEGDKVYISVRGFNETVVRTTKTNLITRDGWKNEHRYILESGREIGGIGIAVIKNDT